ncbi:MAG: pilus assembly protein [Anaerolineales bacterium]|nr:pilus assembly protein [Anaerolineales bacterium]TEU00084.1 MAG: pilus assembly protein [Anaerolineales bacterium]
MLDRENSQRGQGLLEYGMLIILVAVLVIVVIAVLGPSTGNLFSDAVTVF